MNNESKNGVNSIKNILSTILFILILQAGVLGSAILFSEIMTRIFPPHKLPTSGFSSMGGGGGGGGWQGGGSISGPGGGAAGPGICSMNCGRYQ